MNAETSICKHCGEVILTNGVRWVHSKNLQVRCQTPVHAEPIDRLYDAIDAMSYQQGLNDGRKAAQTQERRSNLYRGPLSGVAKEILARAFETRLDDVRRIEGVCESPVEEMFALAAILDLSLDYQPDSNSWNGPDGIRMEAQREIGDYRVDFLFNDRLVVEIDGHDFHDRDHEQASSDRKRDRELLGGGYLVARFTGSDVYNHPLRCVFDAEELLRNVAIERMAKKL